MKRKLCNCYWLPGLDIQVETTVQCCPGCQHSGKSQPQILFHQSLSQHWTSPGSAKAWTWLDHTVLCINASSSWFLSSTTTVDSQRSCSQWMCGPQQSSVGSSSSLHDTAALRRSQFARGGHSLPLRSSSCSLRRMESSQMMASVLNPQENGLVERWNKMLTFGIQAFCSLDRPWEDGISELLSQHRHMPSSPQGPSPPMVFFRHPTRLTFEANTACNTHTTMHTHSHAHTEHE